MAEGSIRVGVVVAWVSLALMLSAQAGLAIWWAGAQNTRVAGIELGFFEMRRSSPDAQRQMMAADRQIAVLESRLGEVLRRLDEMGTTLDSNGTCR